MRTTLPDRPGALAALAKQCGDAGVNILGLQIFPGVEAVTDELVLRTPNHWRLSDVVGLIEGAGGEQVAGNECTEAALIDQPARYVQAARSIIAQPASFPEVVARLFDAEADPAGVEDSRDVMDMLVGEVAVQVRRTAPFTATEHARGAAMADLVGDVLARSRAADPILAAPGRRLGIGATPDYQHTDVAVTALVDGVTVGVAALADEAAAGVRHVSLRVDPAWQRRGIGTRLLADVARVASAAGVVEILISTRADNQAVLPMVLAAGLRGRIRMSGETLTVRIGVRDLRPIPA
ncbi:GNAT family N-acetyltransferase [Nocardioides limicola]|uniref:GNAT family N-acetyltransferase n=1 Tax=Nocardioides limicola TaxID=2803368 RepID=UPI001EF12A9B|nr:GNAT family N-acetyltransferase [Nocardioides sp. DJM-14]